MDAREMLLELLKLPADADDATIEAAKKAYDEAKATPAPMGADVEKQIVAAVGIAMKPLSDKLSLFETASLAATKQRILDAAKMDGKVIALSDEGVAQLSVVALQALVDKTPSTVPLDQRTPKIVTEQTVLVGLSADERAIAVAMGADPDAVGKAMGVQK